jgi:hypothetical protein
VRTAALVFINIPVFIKIMACPPWEMPDAAHASNGVGRGGFGFVFDGSLAPPGSVTQRPRKSATIRSKAQLR